MKNIRTAPEAQAKNAWAPPGGTLGRLIGQAWQRAVALEMATVPGSDAAITATAPSLKGALKGVSVGIIAELKRSSPSRGLINAGLDARRQSKAYADGGAAAVSVLTESGSFGGSIEDLQAVRQSTSLPILRKDFHVAAAQLEEAKQLGASAALVIVRAIEPSRVSSLAAAARDTGIEVVFEIRDEAELGIALDAGAEIIGVNNRDLETLDVDPSRVERILPMIPRECVAIAESGYSTRAQIEAAARAGADAVLVGSALSASDDPMRAVQELAGVPRTPRSS
ncbi:MAG TPA: indole-3-glycerol-phosphate synthase [Gemmatimonadaceae bacterium]|nr:indole-3-glycerol-phosphate synthase [Gemmatimonadaceae bacterium]